MAKTEKPFRLKLASKKEVVFQDTLNRMRQLISLIDSETSPTKDDQNATAAFRQAIYKAFTTTMSEETKQADSIKVTFERDQETGDVISMIGSAPIISGSGDVIMKSVAYTIPTREEAQSVIDRVNVILAEHEAEKAEKSEEEDE